MTKAQKFGNIRKPTGRPETRQEIWRHKRKFRDVTAHQYNHGHDSKLVKMAALTQIRNGKKYSR